jgi:hypothetical protein
VREGFPARRVALAAAGLGVLAWAAAFAVDRALGRDVVVVVPHRDAAEADVARALWRADGSPRTPRDVASVHGRVVDETRVVVRDEGRLRRAEEDPAVALYPVDPDDGRPVQVRTVYFAARVASAVLAAVALLTLLLGRRREAPAVGRERVPAA